MDIGPFFTAIFLQTNESPARHRLDQVFLTKIQIGNLVNYSVIGTDREIEMADPTLHHETHPIKQIAIDYTPEACTHCPVLIPLPSPMITAVGLGGGVPPASSMAPSAPSSNALKATPVASTSTSIFRLLKVTNPKTRSTSSS